MTDPIAPLLARLPEPAPPPALAATIMARIERESAPVRAIAKPRASSHGPSHLGWFWALAGAAGVAALAVQGWVRAGSGPDLTSARIGPSDVVLMPVEGWVSLLLCAALVVFLIGLFAPLREE